MERSKPARVRPLIMAVLVSALSFGAAYAYALTAATPAAADCAGPTIEYEAGAVSIGDEIMIVGRWFGDNCYDTGPPPTGEGTLGVPLRGVEILLVQSVDGANGRPEAGTGREFSLGIIDADKEYAFELSALVPEGLNPGEAWIETRFNAIWDAYDQTDQPFLIGASGLRPAPEGAPVSTEPLPEKPVEIDEIEPTPTTATAPIATEPPATGPPATVQLTSASANNTTDDESGGDRWLLLSALGLGALAIGGTGLATTRRNR